MPHAKRVFLETVLSHLAKEFLSVPKTPQAQSSCPAHVGPLAAKAGLHAVCYKGISGAISGPFTCRHLCIPRGHAWVSPVRTQGVLSQASNKPAPDACLPSP